MRIIAKVICLATGSFLALKVHAQQDYLLPKTPMSVVTLSNLHWSYPKIGQGNVNVDLSVTNNSSKPIKSVKLLVIAKDKKGNMLQSRGTTLKQLMANDTINTGETVHLFFKKGYDNPDVNTLELKETTVEFFNGSLEKISGEAINTSFKNGH